MPGRNPRRVFAEFCTALACSGAADKLFSGDAGDFDATGTGSGETRRDLAHQRHGLVPVERSIAP